MSSQRELSNGIDALVKAAKAVDVSFSDGNITAQNLDPICVQITNVTRHLEALVPEPVAPTKLEVEAKEKAVAEVKAEAKAKADAEAKAEVDTKARADAKATAAAARPTK